MGNTFQTSSVAKPKAAPSDFAAGIREGIIAAILAFGLFVLIVGFKTEQNINNELVLVQRWGLLFILVALSGIGRFLHRAFPGAVYGQAEQSRETCVCKRRSFFLPQEFLEARNPVSVYLSGADCRDTWVSGLTEMG
jgi:hypothetical protein